MDFSESVGTALFIVALVFLILVCLWILLRVMSAVVRKFEGSFIKDKSAQPSQDKPQNPQG